MMSNSSDRLRLWVEEHTQKIAHADAGSRTDFDKDDKDINRKCSLINNLYLAQTDIVTQTRSELKKEQGHSIPAYNGKNTMWKSDTRITSGKRIQTNEQVVDWTQWVHLQRSCSRHSNQTILFGIGTSTRDTFCDEGIQKRRCSTSEKAWTRRSYNPQTQLGLF